jgi:predicted nucleotidyltransferase
MYGGHYGDVFVCLIAFASFFSVQTIGFSVICLHVAGRGVRKMALSKNEVMKIVQDFLASCSQKHDIKQAYLFGSFAKDTACDYSDVDLAIVLKNMRTSEDSIYDEDFEIFHEAQQFNSLLEVVCLPEEVFNTDSGALVQRIKREGVMVMPAAMFGEGNDL